MNKPKLRFKEFTDEWQEKKLGNCLTLMKSGLSRELQLDDIGYPVIRANNTYGGKINFDDLKYWHINDPQGANTQNYILEENDVLVNFINSIPRMGESSVYKNTLGRPAIYTTNLLRLRFNNELDYRIFYNYTLIPKYKNYIMAITKPAVNQASFTTVDFKKMPIKLPKIEEQEKIADFLSKVDELINEHESEVADLEAQKKGLMQKLFTQQIRFKDSKGNNYHDWQEKKLGNIGKFYNGLSGKTKEDFGNGSCNEYYLTYMNIFRNPIAKNNILEMVKINERENQNNIQYGDILFTQSSETLEEVGMSSAWTHQNDKVYLNSFCFGYRFDDIENYCPYFIGYLLRTDTMRKRVFTQGQGSTRFNLSSSRLTNILIPFPCKEEQEQIAKVLCKTDELITEKKALLEDWKQFKKGLLQQMFV